MTKEELTYQFNILKTDLSSLPDTTDFFRIDISSDGHYYLKPKTVPKTNEERVKRILGAIYPYHDEYSLRELASFSLEDRTYSPPNEYYAVEKQYADEIGACVTQNSKIRLLLLLLRREGIIEFGKTPLCGSEDPVVFLESVISGSGLQYTDTLHLLLKRAQLKNELFITRCHKTPGEALDWAIMILSLLSPEDIRTFGDTSDGIVNPYAHGHLCFMSNDLAVSMALPLLFLNATISRSLFSNDKIETSSFERARKIVKNLDDIGFFTNDNPIALDQPYYDDLISICALSGVSCESWLYNNSDTYFLNSLDIRSWIFDRIDANVVKRILNYDGYYLMILHGSDREEFLRSDKYKSFRKYLVDNRLLSDVMEYSFEPDSGSEIRFCLVEIKKNGDCHTVRFFNHDNSIYDHNHSGLKDILFGINPSEWDESIKAYRFIDTEDIVANDYNLTMDLYNPKGWHSCSNPVRLSDILTPIKGTDNPDLRNNSSSPYAYISSLPEHALDNYGEKVTEIYEFKDYGDKLFDNSGIFLAKSSWPLCASFHIQKEGTPGIVIPQWLFENGLGVYKVNTSKANPWYVANELENTASQFNLRNKDGHISQDQFLKMYIDLPSLAEQKRIVEDKLKDEIDRKKRQIGAADVLFDLNHTISLPVSRMQMLLGNLKDMNEGDSETYCQLKKVSDNFEYTLRILKTFSMDYKQSVATKPVEILPLIEKFRSSFSSLPFGFDPEIDHSGIDNRTKVNINEDLFLIVLDNIMRNAHRHGFNKSISPDNKVLIRLDTASYENRKWMLMSVCNNGRKMESNMTVYDFIAQGKKGSVTGNTGQGGYDIYQIVKKFEGHLNIRSNSSWNFIIDILLPIAEDNDNKTISNYQYGPLV